MDLIEAIEYLKDRVKEDEVVIKNEQGIFIMKKEDAEKMERLKNGPRFPEHQHKFYCFKCGDFIKEISIPIVAIPNILNCDKCQKAIDILDKRDINKWKKKRDRIIKNG